MACVAFDLDNTLGFFEVTNALAYLWSPQFLENPEQSRRNGPLKLSQKLCTKLRQARLSFAHSLLRDRDILAIVLRPNLDAMILPLLEAKRQRQLKTVIMYSNTGVSYSTELAKNLIETMYKSPGLFSLIADHWHPLRSADHPNHRPGQYVEPRKTIETLQLLFKRASRSSNDIPLQNILFVDDRTPKHALQQQEPAGLTYLVPSHFVPMITDEQKDYILFLALTALEEHGILSNKEYLESGFCFRDIPYEMTKRHSIRGFPDLLEYVSNAMDRVHGSVNPWTPDTQAISRQVQEFLEQVRKYKV